MSEKEKIRILIVDDHRVVRQGLRSFLELQDDMEICGEASDGIEAIELTVTLKPDVILMDLVMPVMDGITATQQIKALGTTTKIIALTSFTEDDKVFPAIQAGASSYLLKDVSPDELVDAIRAVRRGENRLHPSITRKLMDQVTHKDKLAPGKSSGLTLRELDVIRLISDGSSNQAIAKKLVISEKTVKTHVSNILSKLNMQDRTQLAIYAIKNGLNKGR